MRRCPHITVTYEDGEGGWIVASVREIRGVHSQGRTHDEARANVIDALRGISELRTERGLCALPMLSFESFLARARFERVRGGWRAGRRTAELPATPAKTPIPRLIAKPP